MFGSPNILCPYCLQGLNSKDIEFTCTNGHSPQPISTKDAILGRLPTCNEAPCRGAIKSVRRCKHCGAILPAGILDYEKYLRFSLIGISGCGKTNFLTTMLSEIIHNANAGLTFSNMDAESGEIYQSNYRAIYEDGRPAEKTAANMPPIPQQWSVKDRNRMTNRKIPAYSLTIFDGAGEDFRRIDPVISRYINGSETLVILIDPLTLPAVRRSVARDVLDWSDSSETNSNAGTFVVTELANYIRANCGIKEGRLINRDVAVVFSKIDTVKEHFSSATVMQPSPHAARKGFVKADADAVHEEIRGWLARQGENAFLDAIETNFPQKKIRYFGISSFGQPPIGVQRLGRVMPHRVLDPLMWMLSREKIIPTL